MNAQEAIEIVKELKVFHEKNPKALEALSIALESAKKFHNSHKTEVRSENKLLYYDFSSMINPEELDELGIEKGADE